MSTPTTVKFQIAIPSQDENNQVTEKIYTLTRSLLVESEDGEPEILPGSGVMPIEDPPKTAPVTN